MTTSTTSDDLTRRQAGWMLAAILLVAAGLRLADLGDRTMGHIEAYVPGIEFPYGIAAPHPRITLWETLKGSFEEPHPPAWYVLNWPWTKVFGDELFWLRLPSVLAGLLGIWLIYRVAADHLDRTTGVVAAMILAVHGYHVFWSQIARPYSLSPTLALLGTVLLTRAVGDGARRWRLGYAATSLIGLATSYYYWPFFGAQMLWVFLATAGRRPAWRGILREQLAVLTLATPVVALALFQSRESYLEATFGGVLESLRDEWAGLGYLFRPYGDPRVAPPVGPIALHVLAGLTAVLALVGLAAPKRPSRDPESAGPGPSV
ncbi:MAG: glycosyltransferase family 39 protein, partial [Myxococcales bacterium]|nr:glycosyltransferase family 39 protein [Myxococcales bacterium]